MIYEYFAKIDGLNKFNYIVLVLVIVFLMNRIQPSWHTLVGLLIGIAVVVYLNSKADSNISLYLNSMMRILDDPIFKPYKHLYLDSKLLQFLHESRVYHVENPIGFSRLVKLIDNFIELTEAILSERQRDFNEQYEMLKSIKIRILNLYQAFVYVTPHIDSRLTFYQGNLKKLETLLNYHIDRVHTFVVNKNNQDISVRSMFPLRSNIPGLPKESSMTAVDRYNYFG